MHINFNILYCLQLNVPFAHTNSYKYSFPPYHTTLEFFGYRLCFFLALTHLLCIVYLNNYVLPHVTICFLFYQGMHLISIIFAIVYPLHNMHKVLYNIIEKKTFPSLSQGHANTLMTRSANILVIHMLTVNGSSH